MQTLRQQSVHSVMLVITKQVLAFLLARCVPKEPILEQQGLHYLVSVNHASKENMVLGVLFLIQVLVLAVLLGPMASVQASVYAQPVVLEHTLALLGLL